MTTEREVIRQLVNALQEVEFSDTSGGEYMPKCPWCEERFKHDKECLLNKAIAAGEAELAKPAPVIPEGWKLVPIEATEEMLETGINYRLHTRIAKDWTWERDTNEIYKTMLAVAPKYQANL